MTRKTLVPLEVSARKKVYPFIQAYYAKHQVMPTLYEIGKRYGKTPQWANKSVSYLVDNGYLTRIPNIMRALSFTDKII